MLAFPMVEEHLPLAAYLEAAELYRSARRAGLTVRSSVDCLIATCAIRNSLRVMHKDRDFDALATEQAREEMVSTYQRRGYGPDRVAKLARLRTSRRG